MTEKKFRTPSFARRIGRSLRDYQKLLISELLPQLEVTLDSDFTKASQRYDSIILEIGFGNGEHLAQFAQQNPNTLCIGAEPYINGIATLLKTISDNNISNIRIYKNDVRDLLSVIPNKFFDKIYIICPDPWPKQKQKKRRLINSEFLQLLATKTKKEIVIATDHIDYAKWILDHAITGKFSMPSENLTHYKALPKDWLYTKYQRRGIKYGSDIYYFKI